MQGSDQLESGCEPLPADFKQAFDHWERVGDPDRLQRLLLRALDDDGIPRRWRLPTWRPALERLNAARRAGDSPWPTELDEAIERWERAAARWSRPDRSLTFSPTAAVRPRGGPLLSSVRGIEPSHVCPDRVLGVFRSDWGAKADLLAFDQRERSEACRFEWIAGGTAWFGPRWVSSVEGTTRSPARLQAQGRRAEVEWVEWAFRGEQGRLQRSVVWLQPLRLALLAEQWDSAATSTTNDAEIQLDLAPEVAAERLESVRAFRLTKGSRASAQVIPLALPARPYPTERGKLGSERDALVLRQHCTGKRTWLPLLLSWNAARHRRGVHWRGLTVSENGRACAPEVAFAVRVGWGQDEQYVIYRALARPALRAFLGHQTRARFLVGRFTRTGHVEPILKVD